MADREKRDRKATVEVYTVDSPTKKEFVIEEGSGVKLGDIPNGAAICASFSDRIGISKSHASKR